MSDHPASLRGYRYKPRTIAFQGHRQLGRWRVKGTVITVRGTAAHFVEIVESGWSEADRLLSAVPDDGRDAGVAHLIVHLGLGGVEHSVSWWSDGDTLRSQTLRAPFDDPMRLAAARPGSTGPTVWDLAVQADDRAAWLRHVLANPAGPDLQAYLDNGLSGVV